MHVRFRMPPRGAIISTMPTANVYFRRSNQVQSALRSGPNAIGSYGHLTDELNGDGTPKTGCGDGQPMALRLAPYIIGQNLELIPASSAGTDQDVLIFNDRWSTFSNGDATFAETIKFITPIGELPDPGVQLLGSDGGPLDPNSVVPDGVGLYDSLLCPQSGCVAGAGFRTPQPARVRNLHSLSVGFERRRHY